MYASGGIQMDQSIHFKHPTQDLAEALSTTPLAMR